ncbi:MAG: 50S ribosomal protein L4 [Lentilactobacillus diolivorans]|uniref:Uncharacterized protein n=2 Tax=Lentilactobacillus diolivorans TaxID=179838 RepID=A0A0R1SSR0_9LACO|nr:hypothetical protein [Lentilactobacillus diolivorans]KRL69538.1 hypothetical protein FC85_GL000419 [Lentilactobacillus diolivorans DSM 14421]RRG03843.1 MAG: 50S ribosomal protein L4 [Lactobacillus sp.]GEP23863.1 hypothetical protein LDI01_14560 [Lentilactobacillus diolivorans]
MNNQQSKQATGFKKIPRSVQGNCPHCHRPMQINYGMNRCPSCGYIFKSNFKAE